MNRTSTNVLSSLVVALCGCAEIVDDDQSSVEQSLAPAPANARPANGDFDGDGCTDLGLKSADGTWYIDYCKNGYGGRWDAAFFNYGDATAIPVPADYDGDGTTDLAVKYTTGKWGIDYASTGFGVYDIEPGGYGFADAVPAPADYDGDGKVDLAVKGNGFWGIDLASDGFTGWNYPETESDAAWGGAEAVPVPANYDGDVGPGGRPRADRAVKTTNGEWLIDYSSNGRGKTTCIKSRCFWTRWDVVLSGYGFANAIPVPADYDRDGFADLAIKDDAFWRIDYRNVGGYGVWNDEFPFIGGALTVAMPGTYNPNPIQSGLDLAVHNHSTGYTLIDQRWNGIGLPWDKQVDNPNRPLLQDPTAPSIGFTRVRNVNGIAPIVNGEYQLAIGQKYVVEVELKPGSTPLAAGVAVNSSLRIPDSLRINNRSGTTIVPEEPLTATQIRRVSIVCSVPGSFPLGFVAIKDFSGGIWNADYGIRVRCKGPGAGTISGRVTKRVCLPAGSTSCGVPVGNHGHYSTGVESSGLTSIVGATVTITPRGGMAMTLPPTDNLGKWSAIVPVNVPLEIKVTKPGFSDTIAVNVTVPGGTDGGLEVPTPLEEEFTAVRARGMLYTTYIDYSRGRTIFHVVKLNTASTTLKDIHGQKTQIYPARYRSLVTTAVEDYGSRWPVMINAALFFDSDPNSALYGQPVGYVYSADFPNAAFGGYVPSQVCGEPPNGAFGISCAESNPMLGIVGTGLNQTVRIYPETERNFRNPNSVFFNQLNDQTLWDNAPRDGASDLSYAVQCGNQETLYRDDLDRVAAEIEPEFASTAIGVVGSTVYLVVVDGEGIWGGNGVGGNQLGKFFRNVLFNGNNSLFTPPPGRAMLFDGGTSAEMVLWGVSGARHVNTITGEGNTQQSDPYNDVVPRTNGVPNFVIAGTASP